MNNAKNNITTPHYNQNAARDVYDKVIIGGGPVGLFAAYEILRQARDSGQNFKLALITETINAPSQAGSQIFYGTDSAYIQEQSHEIDALLRSGQHALYDTIKREQIECREHKGLEVKAPNDEDIKEFSDLALRNNVFYASEMRENSQTQRMHFNGYPISIIFDHVGQINVPELQKALIKKIEDLGGKIVTDARFESQSLDPSTNLRTIKTSNGEFKTKTPPILATGARHLLGLPELKDQGETIWTMSVVLGPLSEDDRKKVAQKPTAFALIGNGSEVEADFPWGGLDEKGYLTFGMGDTPDHGERDKIEQSILNSIESFFPGIGKKYAHTRQVSFGAMLVTNNLKPIVGRLKDYEILGGWGGRGITPGYAAALAYADALVHHNDHGLKIFEKMQPQIPFASNHAAPPNLTPAVTQ